MLEKSKDFPDSFHRVTIKGLCVRDGKLLLIRESAALSGNWELPGGGLDFGEDIHEAFKREVKEEMGLMVTRLSKNPVYVWTNRYEKQRNLDWYYSFVVAYRMEVQDLNITPTPECEEIQFFSKSEMQTMPLTDQTRGLVKHFDPEDFEDTF